MTPTFNIGTGLGLTPNFITGGGGYNPVASLGADLIAYWDALRSDLITRDGNDLVSSWKDVKAGYDQVQASGSARPVYNANGFGGDPLLISDGTDDTMQCTDTALMAALPVGSAGCELWFLVRQDVPGNSGVTVSQLGGYSGDNITQSSRYAGRTIVGGVNRARINVANGTAIVTGSETSVDFSSRHVVRMRVTPTTTYISVDGGSETPLAVVPATLATRHRLFSSPSGASGWQGGVAAHLVTLPLSTQKAADLMQYLLARRKL